MSEYQYYQFLAVDRPLDADQQAEVGALSTRAQITATSFINEYHWGDFRGDPNRMMERYYDAHLYLANWGSRRIMLRLPQSLLNVEAVEPYCVDDEVTAWTCGEYLILDLASEDDADDVFEHEEGLLSAIVGVRTEIAAGDLRPLYLAWLAGYGSWERDEFAFDRDADDELEPPVPPGLRALTAPQQALADFLRLDHDLLDIAAAPSPDLDDAADDPRALAAWIADLAADDKDRLLLRVAQESAVVRMELLGRFRDHTKTPTVTPARRTVAELLDASAQRRAERER